MDAFAVIDEIRAHLDEAHVVVRDVLLQALEVEIRSECLTRHVTLPMLNVLRELNRESGNGDA